MATRWAAGPPGGDGDTEPPPGGGGGQVGAYGRGAGRPPPAAGNGLARAGLMAAPSPPSSRPPSLSLFLPARPGVVGSWTLGAVWGCGSRSGARADRRGGPGPSRPPGRAAASAPSPAPGSAATLFPPAPGCGFVLPAAISANPVLHSGNVGLCAACDRR